MKHKRARITRLTLEHPCGARKSVKVTAWNDAGEPSSVLWGMALFAVRNRRLYDGRKDLLWRVVVREQELPEAARCLETETQQNVPPVGAV